jgi:hypothetical protein
MHQKPPKDAELVLPPLKPVVLFAGAGLSVDPPTNAPVWKDVQRRLISVVTSRLQKEDWPCVPELLEHCATLTDGLRPETFFQALHERCAYFDTYALLKHLIGTEPNRHHFAVAEMLHTGHIAAVVTTNFDENIEQAIQLALARPARCCVSGIEYEACAADQADVYKLHGTISKPETISATLSQTAILPRAKAQVLKSLLTDHPVVFVGYSGNDDDIWPVISDSLRDSKNPVIVCAYPGSNPAEPIRSLESRAAIVVEAQLDAVWRALGSESRYGTAQNATAHRDDRRTSALVDTVEKLIGPLPLWQLSSLLGHVALARGDSGGAMFFGELTADILDTRRYGYSALDQARGKLAAQYLELMAQTATGSVMLPGTAYWTGSYGGEELRLDESTLQSLLTTDELCTVILLWAWSDVYHDRLDRVGAYLRRVRQYNSRAYDVRLNLSWVSGVLAYRQGNLLEASVAFDSAIAECLSSNLLTYARVSCDAAMLSIQATDWTRTESLLRPLRRIANRIRDDLLSARILSGLIVVRRAVGPESDLEKLLSERDRLVEALSTKDALLYIVKKGMNADGQEHVEFVCPLCWHDERSAGSERKCGRCGAVLSVSTLKQLRALVDKDREAVLRLMTSDRHQYLVEPKSAIEYLYSSDTSQVITGLVGLYGEARFADRDSLTKQSLTDLLSYVRGSMLELCEDQAKGHSAMERLFFCERWDLLFYVASSSVESATRAMAVDQLASLRGTDGYRSAQTALRVIASDCIYRDTRDTALSKYREGLPHYGGGEDPDLADWLRRTRWS